MADGNMMLDVKYPQDIASVVVTFNPVVKELENVLLAHENTAVNALILVDNGSQNQAAVRDIAASALKRVALVWIPLPHNVGLASALNEGIQRAELMGYTHVALFDQDSEVPPLLVQALAAEFYRLITSGARVGALGPVYIDPRTNSEYSQSLLKGFRLSKVWPNQSPEGTIEVSFIITSGTFASISTLRETGLMRDDFFIDCVDIEWCFRAQSKGFFIYCTNKATMRHTIGDHRVKSLGREISIHSPKRRYYMARNSIYLARLSTVPLTYRLREIFLSLLRTPIFLCAVRFSPEYVRHISIGFLHGALGRLGRLDR